MNKKDEMLQAALELFSKEGYANVGVQKIVEAVDVKKPTLYYYFKSKEGLLEAILEKHFLPFVAKLQIISSNYNGDITRALDEIVIHYFEFSKSNMDFYRLAMAMIFSPEESKTYSSVLKYNITQHTLIENVFQKAEEQHGNMKGRSRMFAFSFIGMINSGISYYFYTKDQNDISEESARKLTKQFMHGIFS